MSCKICYPPKEHELPDLNEALSCFESGEYARAFELALPFAEQGITIAQCMVGGFYQTGLGGEVNGLAAEKWLRQAGEQGCGLAWHNLSTLYLTGGDGVEPNKAEALKCRRRAIENGFDLSAEFPESWGKCYEDLLR